ncbi:sulfur carrier protein ThiS [Candidatus Neoehrlichia procyonis]|uniref:Thiamine biosynthesis protein ThiS n=1 Tax=Candidatus Neoehrlichia procyonis str. RAC413 TaxID=1359163 RepID=A0A0F3NN85_9RICK|nr:sulfur carrier protein ThiS [Candidatus Neoehrlichia lotoris]KJV69221.1 thiamine biosynthesis protein ThiS [Candidatus Neoehrlichia lotoris str. RAC413]
MISIKINNKSKKLPLNTTLLEILSKYDTGVAFAVALNNKLITRTCYKNVYLKDGDVVDIVYPMQGG